MKLIFLIPVLFLTACKSEDDASQEDSSVHQHIVFTGVELMADNKVLSEFNFEVGEMATLKVLGISELSNNASGFSRLCVIHPSGDTLVEIVEPVNEKFNFLTWNFLVTPAFAPGQKYLAVADYFEEATGRALHAEIPIVVRITSDNRQLTFGGSDSLIWNVFARNGNRLYRDGQTPAFGEQLLIVLKINPQLESKEFKFGLSVKNASGASLLNDTGKTEYIKEDGVLSFLLLLESDWQLHEGLSITLQLEGSIVNLKF